LKKRGCVGIGERSDAGKPIVATAPDSPHALIYKEIAARLWAQLDRSSGARTAPKIVMH
jgi:ATP-binding protein involved in chromosome partitioning